MRARLIKISDPIELRIDNIVSNKHGDLHLISANDFQKFRHPDMGGDYGLYKIPLTVSMLLNSGGETRIAGIVYDRFLLTWKDEYKYWYVTDKETGSYITKVEFFHEWQNVVYALNGQELTIKND